MYKRIDPLRQLQQTRCMLIHVLCLSCTNSQLNFLDVVKRHSSCRVYSPQLATTTVV